MRRRNGWGDESEVAHLDDGSRRFLADRRRLRAAGFAPAHARDLRPRRRHRRRRGPCIHPSFEAAVAAMTRITETRDPDPARHALYADLYRNVYLRLYDRLRPLYEEIRRITGYPPAV